MKIVKVYEKKYFNNKIRYDLHQKVKRNLKKQVAQPDAEAKSSLVSQIINHPASLKRNSSVNPANEIILAPKPILVDVSLI